MPVTVTQRQARSVFLVAMLACTGAITGCSAVSSRSVNQPNALASEPSTASEANTSFDVAPVGMDATFHGQVSQRWQFEINEFGKTFFIAQPRVSEGVNLASGKGIRFEITRHVIPLKQRDFTLAQLSREFIRRNAEQPATVAKRPSRFVAGIEAESFEHLISNDGSMLRVEEQVLRLGDELVSIRAVAPSNGQQWECFDEFRKDLRIKF